MLNYRAILYIIGFLLTILSGLMLIPLTIDLISQDYPHYNFAISFFLTIFIGSSLIITCKTSDFQKITLRETFLLTTITWVFLTFFAALPFYFAPHNLSFTDSFFESMSGLTTTGASIINDLTIHSPGILTWRALLHWFGGIGVVVFAITILPILRIGGMQLFQSESSDNSEKILPRMHQIALAIILIYVFFTISCTALLYYFGASLFDAILHAMSVVSSGGFSPHNESVGYFNSPQIEAVLIFYMILSALPFPIFIAMLRGSLRHILKDSQVITFLSLLTILTIVISLYIQNSEAMPFFSALRQVSFTLTAIITTTGFAATDYSNWGIFAVICIFLISVMGGCTGSTTGGIKIFRFQILYKTAKFQLNKLLQPHLVSSAKYNNKAIQESTSSSVMSFFILFAFFFCIIALVLASSGLDFVSSLSGAAASIGNVGPALGNVIGPAGNYSSLTDYCKWVLSFAMLIGRLEIFTVLVLFTKDFWKD